MSTNVLSEASANETSYGWNRIVWYTETKLLSYLTKSSSWLRWKLWNYFQCRQLWKFYLNNKIYLSVDRMVNRFWVVRSWTRLCNTLGKRSAVDCSFAFQTADDAPILYDRHLGMNIPLQRTQISITSTSNDCHGVSNYANPVYNVSTICHQVRCLRCIMFPRFATRFAAYAGGILVSFIQPHLFLFDIKCSAWELYHTDLYGWNL